MVGRVGSSLCGVTAGSAKASLSAHFVTGGGALGEVEAVCFFRSSLAFTSP